MRIPLSPAALLCVAGSLSSQVVINEVYYDAPGTDDGQVFVELYGPAGTDISGWRLQSIEGTTGSGGTCNPQLFTFPTGALIPASGFVLVADTTSTGSTTVPNPTFTSTNLDLENGGTTASPSGDALQLLNAAGLLVDAVAYGAVDTSGGAASACNGQGWFEGNPARDVFAPLSIERCPAGRDTGDNATNFTPNVPTPGTGDACCTAIEWVDLGTGSTVATATGGKVGLDLFLSCGANKPYLLLGAFTNPAQVPPPPPFPVLDAATLSLVPFAGAPPFVAWIGTLSANGDAVGVARLDFTGVPVTLGAAAPMYIGAIAFDQNNKFVGTNSVTINLQ